MLNQKEADDLLVLAKVLLSAGPITFPGPGGTLILDSKGITTNDKFAIDVNRKGGRIKVTKCTYQTRTSGTILLRVDLDGPPHLNPDGVKVDCPHIHIYREGYGEKWAFPLNQNIQTNPANLPQVLVDFLVYNNIVSGIPPIQDDSGDLL